MNNDELDRMTALCNRARPLWTETGNDYLDTFDPDNVLRLIGRARRANLYEQENPLRKLLTEDVGETALPFRAKVDPCRRCKWVDGGLVFCRYHQTHPLAVAEQPIEKART